MCWGDILNSANWIKYPPIYFKSTKIWDRTRVFLYVSFNVSVSKLALLISI